MDFTFAGGCIRLTDDGPQWHINTRHTTVGFDTSVEPEITAAGDIYVSLVDTLDIVSLMVNVDETLAEKGVWVGGSGGVSGVTIKMRKNGATNIPLDLNNSSDYASVKGAYSNLWLFLLRVAGTEEG